MIGANLYFASSNLTVSGVLHGLYTVHHIMLLCNQEKPFLAQNWMNKDFALTSVLLFPMEDVLPAQHQIQRTVRSDIIHEEWHVNNTELAKFSFPFSYFSCHTFVCKPRIRPI